MSQTAADDLAEQRAAEQVTRVMQPRGDAAEAKQPGHGGHGDAKVAVRAAADRCHSHG